MQRIFRLLFVGVLCFSATLSDAATLEELTEGLEQKIFSHDDIEAIQMFREMKASIEIEAESQTLRLCEGYRAIRGLPPGHVDRKFPRSESIAAWGKILSAGLQVPFSSMAGQRSKYVRLNDLKLYAFSSWFGSLYSVFLVQSWGFIKGASHCLNTVDPKEINYFAATIMAVDYQATLASEVAIGVAVEKAGVVFAIQKIVGWIWMPVRYVVGVARKRIARPVMRMGGLTVATIGADQFMQFAENLERSKAAVREIFEENPSQAKGVFFEAYVALLARGYQVFASEVGSGESQNSKFVSWAKSNIDQRMVQSLKQAFQRLEVKSKSEALSPFEANARILMSAMLPLLEDIELPKML